MNRFQATLAFFAGWAEIEMELLSRHPPERAQALNPKGDHRKLANAVMPLVFSDFAMEHELADRNDLTAFEAARRADPNLAEDERPGPTGVSLAHLVREEAECHLEKMLVLFPDLRPSGAALRGLRDRIRTAITSNLAVLARYGLIEKHVRMPGFVEEVFFVMTNHGYAAWERLKGDDYA